VLIGVVSIGEFGKESDSEEVEFNFWKSVEIVDNVSLILVWGVKSQ
jgi:hypothetical protein